MKRSTPLLGTALGAMVIVLALSGCSSVTKVKVDAVAKPDAERSIAYRIETNNPHLDRESLQYREAERLVKTALSGKGLYEAPKAEMADMVVSLDYGVSPPQVIQEERFGTNYYTSGGTDDRPQLTSSTYTVSVITYEKYLRLSARENKPSIEGEPPAHVWTVTASTEGQSHDLRKALPVLSAATIEYVGTDTYGEKIIKLKDKDPDGAVAFVKKGM